MSSKVEKGVVDVVECKKMNRGHRRQGWVLERGEMTCNKGEYTFKDVWTMLTTQDVT